MLNQRLYECFKSHSFITALESFEDNSILISTRLHGLKLLSECTLTQNFLLEHLGDKTTAVALSAEHKLLAFANSQTLHIVNITNKTTIGSIKTDEGEIEILSFVKNSPYIIAGTKEGRVSQYRYDAKAQLSRLCSFPYKHHDRYKIKNNYVSALAFHGGYMAASGYGGTITLMKISSLADKRSIGSSNVRINALCFLDKEHLLSGSVDGTLEIHSLVKMKKTKRIQMPFRDIKQILHMPNPNYVMISGASNRVALIELSSAKLVSSSYLEFDVDVSLISLEGSKGLLIALEDGTLYRYEFATAQELKSHILHNTLTEAFELIEHDPMLRGSREHKQIEAIYKRLYAQAIEALSHSKIKEAHLLIEELSSIKSKKEELNAIFKDFKHYARFKLLVDEQKYALAYAMSERFASLKETAHYKEMEKGFKDAYTHSQKMMLAAREDLAQELLSPYMSVLTKKPLITLLLKQNRDFIDFLKAIEAKDYTTIEKLLKKSKLFMQIPTYSALKEQESRALGEIAALIENSQIDRAIEMIKELQRVPSIQAELQELYRISKLVLSLEQSYRDGDFVACYELLDKNYELSEIELSRLLEKHWSKLMHECEVFAQNGDIKSIKAHLGELIGIKTRLSKIGDLLRVSFHSKVKALLTKRDFIYAENIIYSYIDIFGIDSELRALMKIYEKLAAKKLAITLDQERAIARDSWVDSPLIIMP